MRRQRLHNNRVCADEGYEQFALSFFWCVHNHTHPFLPPPPPPHRLLLKPCISIFLLSLFFFFFFKFAQHVLPRLIFKRPANTIFSHQWKYIYMAEYSRKTRLWSASTDGVIDRRELQRGTQASASHINCSRRLKDVNLIYVQCSPSQTPFWGVALQARRSCVSRADVDFWRLEIPFLVPASLH